MGIPGGLAVVRVVYCKWSIDTNHVSHMISETLSLKHLGIMTLTIWDHVISCDNKTCCW